MRSLRDTFNDDEFWVLTNPLFWITFIVLALVAGAEKVMRLIYGNKRSWIVDFIDYLQFKNRVKEGLTYKQIDHIKSWIERHPDHYFIENITKVVEQKTEQK